MSYSRDSLLGRRPVTRPVGYDINLIVADSAVPGEVQRALTTSRVNCGTGWTAVQGAVWHSGTGTCVLRGEGGEGGETRAAVLGPAKKRPALWEETCLIPTRRYTQTCLPNEPAAKSQLQPRLRPSQAPRGPAWSSSARTSAKPCVRGREAGGSHGSGWPPTQRRDFLH